MTRRRPLPVATYPYSAEREYVGALTRMVDELAREISREMIPAFEQATREFSTEIKLDAWPETIEAAISRLTFSLSQSFTMKVGRRVIRKLGDQVSSLTRRQWTVKAIGVNAYRREPWLRNMLQSWAMENANLIKSIPVDYLATVAQRTHDMVRSGQSIATYREELQRQYDLTRSRANLIARTEIAKLNGQITRARQTRLGIPEYTWRTSGDERVRKSHEVLEGKICRWDDSTVFREEGSMEWRKRSEIGGYEGIPGEDFQCRCTAAANVEDFLDQILGVAA